MLILWLIQALRSGLEYNAGLQDGADDSLWISSPGAVVNPFKIREPDLMMQLYKLELKIAAGARFIITQLGFNLRKLYELKQYMLREGWARISGAGQRVRSHGHHRTDDAVGRAGGLRRHRRAGPAAGEPRRSRSGWSAPP